MTEDDRQPPSEDAALRELEELQRQIERSRARRRDANDAFDRFVREFDRPVAWSPLDEEAPAPRRPPMPPPPVEVNRAVAPPLPATEVSRLAAPPEPTSAPPPPEFVGPSHGTDSRAETFVALSPPDDMDRLPDFVAEEAIPVAVHSAKPPQSRPSPAADQAAASRTKDALNLDRWEERAPPKDPRPAFPFEEKFAGADHTEPLHGETQVRRIPAAVPVPRRLDVGRIPPAIGVLGAVVAGAIAFFVWRGVNRDGDSPGSAPAATTAPARPESVNPTPVTPAPPRPPAAAEVITTRRVWLRVLVDGRKVMERELPPDSRIPLDSGSQLVVRAGDAGAVRVAIGGRDQGTLGRDGEVATKAYAIAPKPAR